PDVAAIKQVNDEIAQGASFRALVRSLIASSHGQLAFDFRLEVAPARVIALRPKPPAPAPALPQSESPQIDSRNSAWAEEYFRAASSIDDGDESKREEAAAAYRKALELDPYLVAAMI